LKNTKFTGVSYQISKLFFTGDLRFRKNAQKQGMLLLLLYKNMWKMKKILAK